MVKKGGGWGGRGQGQVIWMKMGALSGLSKRPHVCFLSPRMQVYCLTKLNRIKSLWYKHH